MNWYKKAYNEQISYLNQYFKKGFDPWDYMYFISDYLEEIEHPYSQIIEEGDKANQNNLFGDKNLFYTDPDDYSEQWLQEATPQEIEQFKEWIIDKNLDASRPDAPPYEIMNYTKFIKPTWLLHFTNDPEGISNEGFSQGWENIEGLAYTTHYNKKHKNPGYNFAFDINDTRDIRSAARENKYGDSAVLFWGSGVKSTHYGDEEEQVIIWGPSVNTDMIIPIVETEGGDWGVMREGYGDSYPMKESEDIIEVVNWAINNIDMVRQTLGKWKNKKKQQPQMAQSISWYKKAQKLEVLDYSDMGREGKHYTDIGHDITNEESLRLLGKENINYNEKIPNMMWIYKDGQILVKPETVQNTAHRSPEAWGLDKELDKMYTGRYSPSEKTISVLPPYEGVGQFRDIPKHLQYLLKQKFPDAERIIRY